MDRLTKRRCAGNVPGHPGTQEPAGKGEYKGFPPGRQLSAVAILERGVEFGEAVVSRIQSRPESSISRRAVLLTARTESSAARFAKLSLREDVDILAACLFPGRQ